MMPQTVETLHPDIATDLANMGRRAVAVIDPSPGIFGGAPIAGLVRVKYRCDDRECIAAESSDGATHPHTHDALYGPKLDDYDGDGFEIYAD